MTEDQKKQPQDDNDADEQKFGKIPDEGEFVVYGTVYCKPEHADTLAALYSKMTKIAKTEPGVIYYKLARNSKDPVCRERTQSSRDFPAEPLHVDDFPFLRAL